MDNLPPGWDIPPLEPRPSYDDIIQVLSENVDDFAGIVPKCPAELWQFILDYGRFDNAHALKSIRVALAEFDDKLAGA